MKRWLLALLMFAAACGHDDGKNCTLKGCLAGLTISVADDMGGTLAHVRGTATFAGRTVSFECQNGQTVSMDTNAYCDTSSVIILGPADTKADVMLDVDDGGMLQFSGTVTPAYVTDDSFNGPGCGSCTSGQTSIVLR